MLFRVAATVAAILLLCIQINFAVEHSSGSSNGALAAAVAAYVCLALLPLLAISAFRDGRPAWGACLAAATVCFLAYSLPISVGRAGEASERATLASTEYQATRDAMERECGTGAGPRCRGRIQTLERLGPRPVGDLGTEAMAWILSPFGIDADAIRRVSAIFLGIGLDLAVLSLSGYAGGAGRRRPAAVAPEPEPEPERARSDVPAETKVTAKKPAPTKRKATLGEAWLKQYLEDNPQATLNKAFADYKAAKLNGRLMGRNRFARAFAEMRPSNIFSIAA